MATSTVLLLLALLGEQVVTAGPVTQLDRALETALVPHRANVVVEIARRLTWLGNPDLVVPLVLVLAAALAWRRRSATVLVRVLALVGALGLAVLVLKDVVARPAPHGSTAKGGAWPSGHAATAVVVWGAAARLVLRGVPAVLCRCGPPFLVGVCMVAVGDHQLSDVLAGWLLGVVLLQLPLGGGTQRDGRPPAPAARPGGRGGVMSDQVRVVAALRTQPGQGGVLLGLWPALSRQVRAEDGCLAYDLHRVAGDADRFMVLERWASVEALGVHGRSAHMREFGRTAAELLATPSEITVLEDDPAG